jgi:hypothetical protein
MTLTIAGNLALNYPFDRIYGADHPDVAAFRHAQEEHMAPTVRFDTIRTDRLVMRRWQDSDKGPFAELNADPEGSPLRPSVTYRLVKTS